MVVDRKVMINLEESLFLISGLRLGSMLVATALATKALSRSSLPKTLKHELYHTLEAPLKLVG